MKYLLEFMITFGLMIVGAPAVQGMLREVSDVDSFIDMYQYFLFFLFFPMLPILFFYFFIRKFFNGRTQLFGQICAGLFTVLLYCIPTITSLFFIFDIDGFASSDALSGLLLLIIPLLCIGASTLPAIGLYWSYKNNNSTLSMRE
jgi:hypothetical protein